MKQAEKLTAWIIGLIAASLTVVILWWILRDPSAFVEQKLGASGGVFSMPFVWIVALAIAFGYITYTAAVVPLVRKNLWRFSWLKVLGIWAAIVTGIVEEIVFRQLLMDWLGDSGLNVLAQIVISAAVFGIGHSLWILMAREWKVAIPVVLSTFALGLLLASLYIFADRSTLPSIVAHALINIGIEPWLILSVVSGGQRSTAKSVKMKA